MSRTFPGLWRHVAIVEQHDLTLDAHGLPTYDTAADWDTVIEGWPCMLESVNGGERLRGRQVAPDTTHVLIGEYFGGRIITPDMRVRLPDIDGNDVTYQVTAAYDPAGDAREWRVEMQRQFRQQVPVLSVTNQEVTDGVAIDDYRPGTTALAESWTATGLPVGSGITFDEVTGIFSGTPNATDLGASPITVTVTATNEGGTSTAVMFEFEVLP